ncbi:MAG TPA: glycoside hydrolase family 3 N-terminal domain-containing protein, partial [Terriglobales bacterium]
NPKEVVTFARRFLKGLSSAKVLGCGKHFPGLGEANLDTHKEFPSIRKPWKALWEQDLYPFRELKNILPMMMVSHAGYPEIDDAPASLSRKWITGILRKKIGYEGLVLSDDLEMGGVLTAGSIEDVAIETLQAGADIFLVCNKEDLVWRGYEAVLQRAERDRKFERLVNHAAERVLRFKKKAREVKSFAAAPDETTVARLRENMQKFTQLVEARTRTNA